MFKPIWGVCVCHGKNRILVNKKGLCQQGRNECNNNKRRSDGNPGFGDTKRVQKLPEKFRFKKLSPSPEGKVTKKNIYTNQKKKFQVLNRFKRVKKNPTGEKALFLEIWDERSHVCSCCSAALGEEPKPIFFSHLLSKGAYPAFRLLKRNIWLKCEECHVLWETASRNTDRFKLANIEFQSLKQLYYANSK